MSTTTRTQDAYDTESEPRTMSFDVLALAGAAAVVSAIVMLLFGFIGAIGVYERGIEAMEVAPVLRTDRRRDSSRYR
jgi:hypothetical protein